ncbi:ABC transporter substrate-binding protein [Alphaproteobacteria bacterium KMM 3653]|uniref:ABC transporter substrate-binding protein n=1 Tax=Harenicola maris TaxID=2841044 RepID=A0AAP2CQF2_9RHOB|nr:ABC transporter substrate-binding protein [Harenicola maris]
MPSNFSSLNRRQVMGGLAAFGAMALTPFRALALSVGGAESLVTKLVDDINKVIASGKSEQGMYSDFERIFVRYADVPTIARYALGNDGRSASKAQIRAFTKAYQGYISRKYGSRFREFIGGKLEMQGARAVKSFVEVKTTAILKGQSPFEVTFLVSDRSGSDKFFNMFIEGVNMLLSERTEIGALLDRRGGDLDQLTKDLKSL